MGLKTARYYVHMRHFWLARFESLQGHCKKKKHHTQCFLSGQPKQHKTGNRNGNVFWKSQPWISKLSFSEVKARYNSVWGHYPLFNLKWKSTSNPNLHIVVLHSHRQRCWWCNVHCGQMQRKSLNFVCSLCLLTRSASGGNCSGSSAQKGPALV